MATCQSLSQSLLIDQRTTSGVDKNGTTLHLRQSLGIHQTLCGGVERTVERHHIAVGEQRVHIGFLNAFRQLLLCLGSVSQYLHAKRQGNLCHRLADIAQPHDAHHLAVEFHHGRIDIGEVLTFAPCATVRLGGVVLHAVGDVEQVGKHDLCHRASAVGRHIGHHHAMLARRVEVDDIVACGNHADIFEVGERFNHVAAHHHLVGEDDLRVGSACYHLLGCGAVVHSALAQCFERCPTQVARIAGKAVEHHDFHFFVHFTTVFWLEQS